MDEKDVIVRNLQTVTRRRKAAEKQALDLRAETDRLIVEGVAEGVPKRQLAREAGMTPQTIYTVLLKAGAKS